MASSTYMELLDKFEKARQKYVALVKGAEAGHMMLGQYADEDDLVSIRAELDEILVKAKDGIADYNEYVEITSISTALRNAVETVLFSARYISDR